MVFEVAQGRPVPALINMRAGSGNLPAARNETVEFFLDQTPAEWLLTIDSDMGFEMDTMVQLIGSADPQDRPVVGALAFGLKKNGPEDWGLQATRFHQFPTLYRYREDDDKVGFQVIADYERDAMNEVSGTGAAVFRVRTGRCSRRSGDRGLSWFSKITHPKPAPHGTEFGEDLSFFVRVAGVGAPVWVNTAIKTSHDKGGVFLTEETWDAQQVLVALAANAA